ncbi:MAG: hypothetical protein ACRD6W_11275, partial [Nitrososphaerales archaeon]
VISICAKAGKDSATMARRIRIARALGSDKLRKLYEVERRSGFRFGLGHVEEFTKLQEEDDLTMFQVAAVTANGKFDPRAVKPEAARELVKSVAWFPEAFPEYATEPSSPAIGAAMKGRGGGSRVTEPTLVFLQCPHCGAQNPFKHKENVTFTFLTELRSDGRVQKKSVEPLGVYITPVECVNPTCSGRNRGKREEEVEETGQFWAVVSFRDEDAKGGQGRARRVTLVQRYDSEAGATAAVLSSLKGRAMAGAMRFDSKRERYMVLDERDRLLEMDERYRLREAEPRGEN